MLAKGLDGLINKTNWGELDYLIVDFPPGTGDVQISMSQKLKLNGVLIITTPQILSVNDVLRGIQMFIKLGIPIIGAVENMTYVEIAGKKEFLFGNSKAKDFLLKEKVEIIEEIEFNKDLTKSCDNGKPYCYDYSNTLTKKFQSIANQMINRSFN